MQNKDQSTPSAPASPPIPTLTVQQAIELSARSASAGRHDEAAWICRRILDVVPDHAEAHHRLGLAVWRAGRSGEAVARLRHSVACRPESAEPLGNLGIILRALGRFEQAAACLRRALAIAPDLAPARNALAAIERRRPAEPVMSGLSQPPGALNTPEDVFPPAFVPAARALIQSLDLPEGEAALSFLLANPEIFRNRFLLPFTHHAFGHNIMVLDWCSRLYHPLRVSVILVPGIRDNPYLPHCFRHTLDVFSWQPPAERRDGRIERRVCASLRALLHLYAGMRAASDDDIRILDPLQIYATAPKTREVLAGSEEYNHYSTDVNVTGYARLIEEGAGCAARLPEDDLAFCRDRIRAAHPGFFDRPFVTMLLRSKGIPQMFSDFSRSSGPQGGYTAAVRHFIKAGFHVVGTGETDHAVFRGINGYFDLAGTGIPEKLLNVFVLTNCSLFVGQHSGTYMLPGAAGIPCLLTDALPHRLGIFGRHDIVLHKNLKLPGRDAPLSLLEIYREHPDLACGVNFAAKGAWYEPNTAEEILDAAREAIRQVAEPDSVTSDVRSLADRLRAAIPPYMPVAHYASRPPARVLLALRDDLAALPG